MKTQTKIICAGAVAGLVLGLVGGAIVSRGMNDKSE